ncbi:PAS domain-containing protein [Rhodobacter sp. TJ_12]|uniref:PAS domain-containing protein n=1 Tax=Rhodobacter sp. TJ_12 TaxID=2029399 RepID=UPI001CBAA2C2|nr:PAS domain-containing protein [Rhodobacter sp. TJ_12]MBZ4022457.1 PAS domain-containing protein [Rhodobacter sp. TJ_12]
MDRELDMQGKAARLGETGVSRRVVAQMRAYWEGLRKGRDVPARAEIDPRGLESALEYAFILERVAPGMGRFRLAGMHLNDLMGMEVRGMPLTALFTPEGRKRVADATEAVFSGPSVAELVLTAEAGIGKPPMTARLILLPMKSDMGDVTRILGCLVGEGQAIGRTPRRFLVDAVHVEPIKKGEPTQARTPAPVRPEAFGLGARLPKFGVDAPKAPSAPQPFTPSKASKPAFAARTPEERRAMFRVVSSD